MEIGNMEVNIEEDERGDWEDDEYDDGEFDPKLLKAARSEEVHFMEKIGVWEDSTWEECVRKTGKPPITTKWVDVDKGRDGEVLMRSRLVARDFKMKGDERGFDVFAATPPARVEEVVVPDGEGEGQCGR
jgi:hypothetical protein